MKLNLIEKYNWINQINKFAAQKTNESQKKSPPKVVLILPFVFV